MANNGKTRIETVSGLREARARVGRPWFRLAVTNAVLLSLCGSAVLIWVFNDRRLSAEVNLEHAQSAGRLARRATELIDAEVARGKALAAEFSAGGKWDAKRFGERLDALIKPSPAFVAVAWVPRSGTVEYTSLDKSGKDEPLGRGDILKMVPPWGYALAKVAQERGPRVVGIERRNSKMELWCLFPATSGEGSAAGYQGCIAARIDLGTVLAKLTEEPGIDQYDVRVEDRGMQIFKRGEALTSVDTGVLREPVRVANRYVQMKLRPTAQAMSERATSAGWVLWVGLFIAAGVSGSVWWALGRRAGLTAEALWQFEAFEELNRAAGAVSTELAAGHGALDQLASSARRLLGMKSALISMVDVAAHTIELVARDGLERDRPTLFPLNEGKGTRECFDTGRPLVVENTRTDPRVNGKVLADLYGMVSVIMIPLSVAERPVGVMYLGDDKPRKYTRKEVRLAGVLGAQAGVFLAILRLVREKDQSLREQTKLAQQQEAMFQIAAEIYRTEDLGESLQRLADAAPALIGVDRCTVALRTGRGSEVQIYAVTGNFGGVRGERHDMAGATGEESWTTREPVVIPDGPGDAKLLPALRHRLHIGSIVFLPLLRTDRKPIGMMTLIRDLPGEFSKEEIDLGNIMAARAATAIEKARLYASARRLAHSQETLLRELNHRVKNNLSSIVSLLQVGRPRMPEEAMRWLNRVTGRVATMARTHELFIGGASSVGVDELVSKLLPSLSVVKPPGAEVRTHLEAGTARLPTDRAISLAMVLNELCWNALEHGVGETGLLEIRARRHGEGRLIVEVEDDGGRRRELAAVGMESPAMNPSEMAAVDSIEPLSNDSSFSAPPAGDGGNLMTLHRNRGMGLRLVEGLVSRELGGKFVLLESASGGTLARVDLPIMDEGQIPDETGVAEGVAGKLS